MWLSPLLISIWYLILTFGVIRFLRLERDRPHPRYVHSLGRAFGLFFFLTFLGCCLESLSTYSDFVSPFRFISILGSLCGLYAIILLNRHWKKLSKISTSETLDHAYKIGLAQNEIFMDAFIVHNGKEILYANEAFSQLYGWDNEEIVGKFYTDLGLFPPEVYQQQVKAKVRKKKWGAYPSETLTKDKRLLHVIINAKGMKWEGQDARAISFRNITPEVELRKRLLALQDRTQAKGDIDYIKFQILSSLENNPYGNS